MLTLDGPVRLVSIQFSFSNPKIVPQSVKRLEHETPARRAVRKGRADGTMVIAPTPGVSMGEFVDQLEAAGYELVDALYEPRINTHSRTRENATYHMMRFIFARREFVDLSEWFRGVRVAVSADLRKMCGEALWRVRVFSNPFRKDGEEISGQRALSVNLEVRVPLGLDGQPPIKAQQVLRVVDGAVRLAPSI